MALSGHVASPTPAKKRGAPSSRTRFTVRDGFHLRTRNAEAQAAVERLVRPPQRSPEDAALDAAQTSGPTEREIAHAAAPGPSLSTTSYAETPELALDGDGRRCDGSSHAVAVLGQLGGSEQSARSSGRVCPALQAPVEWLIQRARANETPQRQQRQAERLLRDVLAEPSTSAKTHETQHPTRPRVQATRGSTYSQRVSAARPRASWHGRDDHLAPVSSTERSLLRSRETNNQAVDRLLVSLFPPPSTEAKASRTARFATRRSVIRLETAVALRSRKLQSRVHELRSLPQLLQHMEALRQHTRQRRVQEHGTDLVAQNRANVRRPKAAQTPVATDHKLQQAQQRKQELDAAQEQRVRHAVDRWQTRRALRLEHARRQHVQSQWLLLVALAERTHTWLARFRDRRDRRLLLLRAAMAKRLQRYWRQQLLLRRSSPQQLLQRASPLSALFLRLPVVSQAVLRLQRCVRAWLARKQHAERSQAAALLVTAWLAFQDVKFRRLILCFRKRVRAFQAMWRSWRAVTDARVKLLLLVWAKLERKLKRRGGVASSSVPDATRLATRRSSHSAAATTSSTGLTLVQVFQEAAAERLLLQQHKKLEDMHRHLRNGGTVQVPRSALAPCPPTSPSASGRAAPRTRALGNANVRRDLELRHHMTDEFQLAMYDVYTTNQKLSNAKRQPLPPTRAAGESSQSLERRLPPSRTRRGPSRGPQSQKNLPLQLPSSPMAFPAPPPGEKVPHPLKVALLRQLISDKRKQFSDARDRGQEEWVATRKQMRNAALRYDVLDELAAFQQLQAKYATFLMLHSISEDELVQLISKARSQASSSVASASAAAAASRPAHGHPSGVTNANKKSSNVVTSSSGDAVKNSHAVIAIGSSVLQRFDNDE